MLSLREMSQLKPHLGTYRKKNSNEYISKKTYSNKNTLNILKINILEVIL